MRQTLILIACFSALAAGVITFSSFALQNAAEVGKCGYYADSFHGRPTASGEKYNKDALTCSHKTLAFGTKIRVTRLDNKKSVVVRVNDRGPFIEGYIIDVSSAAARELDLLKVGSARVKTEIVESAESSLTSDQLVETEAYSSTQSFDNQLNKALGKPVTYSKTSSPKGIASYNTGQSVERVEPSSNLYKVDIKQTEKNGYGVQITTLSDANNVLPFLKELQAKYTGKVLVNVIRDEFNNPTYKVIVGPFADKKTANAAQKIIAQKHKKTIIVDLGDI